MKCRVYLMLAAMCAFMAMQSCSDDHTPWTDPDDGTEQNDKDKPGTEIPDDGGDPGDDDLDPNSQDVDYENAVFITFDNGSVEIDNQFEGDVAVTADNGHVVINSALNDTEAYYVLSGIVDDGSVKIYGSYKFTLVLNGVGITNPKGAAINIQCGKKITVILEDQTSNRLVDGATYTHTTGEDMKGTFFSEGQLIFEGNGNLEVRGKNKHGICSDDYIKVNSGNIWVKEASSDALHANDYIKVNGGTLTTRSEGEGIDCEKGYVEICGGEIDIVTTGGKGHGIKSSDYTYIDGDGTVGITVYGNASKCINAKGDVTIRKGTINLSAAGDAIWDTDDNDTSSCAGIKCSGNMVIDGGTITSLSTGSGGKGINVDGTLVINDGTITVTTTGDQYVYDRNNDTAAKAIKSTGNLTINGGVITVRTSKTEAEGIESKATLSITGGDLDIQAYDDCLNASDHIQIDGGTIYCYSQANDGIDSNGTLTITGGTIVSVGAASPEDGIDCDNNRFTITGGTIIGLGGSTSSPTENACSQRSVIFRTSSKPEIINIRSSSGTEVLTFKCPRTYSGNTTLLFSSAGIQQNTTYTIYTGGSITGGTNFHGLYSGAAYTTGSSGGTFTANSMVSTVGTSTGGGNNGGGRP